MALLLYLSLKYSFWKVVLFLSFLWNYYTCLLYCIYYQSMYCKCLSVQSIFVRALDWNVKENAYRGPKKAAVTCQSSRAWASLLYSLMNNLNMLLVKQTQTHRRTCSLLTAPVKTCWKRWHAHGTQYIATAFLMVHHLMGHVSGAEGA